MILQMFPCLFCQLLNVFLFAGNPDKILGQSLGEAKQHIFHTIHNVLILQKLIKIAMIGEVDNNLYEKYVQHTFNKAISISEYFIPLTRVGTNLKRKENTLCNILNLTTTTIYVESAKQ